MTKGGVYEGEGSEIDDGFRFVVHFSDVMECICGSQGRWQKP